MAGGAVHDEEPVLDRRPADDQRYGVRLGDDGVNHRVAEYV